MQTIEDERKAMEDTIRRLEDENKVLEDTVKRLEAGLAQLKRVEATAENDDESPSIDILR
jgi:exonuclease VII small subunit